MRCAITTQIAKTCGALTFLFFRDRCAGTLLERQEAKWAGKFCLHDEDGNSSHDNNNVHDNARFSVVCLDRNSSMPVCSVCLSGP